MKVKYIKRFIRTQETNEFFTDEKEYEVLADYRKRVSGQQLPDNGFVVVDNLGQQRMVFSNEGFVITDNEVNNTYVFSY